MEIQHIVQWRIHVLKSGVGTDPENLPHLFQLLSKDENQGKPDPFKTILSVIGFLTANHLMMVAMVELVIVSMIITMILQKREQVKQALEKNLPGTGLRALLVRIWHHLAIIAFLLLWILAGFNLLLGGVRPGAPDIQTLLIIPLYFLLDWGLREVLRVVFGIAPKSEDVRNSPASEASDNTVSPAIGETGAKAKSLADSETAKEDPENV